MQSRIANIEQILPPIALFEKFPLSPIAKQTVIHTRQQCSHIIQGRDDRLIVIIGPCSIHDPISALDYAKRLKVLQDRYQQELVIIMRVYFEKPRTTIGWKGLINDPYLDHSFAVNDGLQIARKLLTEINDLALPTAGEFLDMMTPQYLADLMSWGAIGARTTESQVHRELASGLNCPVGFKNATNGSVKIALDAIRASEVPHSFLSVTKFGHSALIHTTGNPDCHIILRGGENGTNYQAEQIEVVAEALKKMGKIPHVMVDFSHANCQKDPQKQLLVGKAICEQLKKGSKHILGVMIESHLIAGNQPLSPHLTYGQSITDPCLGWHESEILLHQLSEAVKARREKFVLDR